jgi:hypothetical protein
VRSQVEQHAACLLGPAALAPLPRVDLRPPALEARLEPQQLAERPRLHQPPQRQEVAVPTPVVEDARKDAARRGRVGKLLSLRRAHGQRLVHHDVQPGLDRRQPKPHVLPVRRGHNHQVMRVRGGEQRVGIRQHRDLRIPRAHLRGALLVRRDDRGK